MTAQARGLQVSVALHALLAGVVLAGSFSVVPRERRIVLDFSVGTAAQAPGIRATAAAVRKPAPAAPRIDQQTTEPRKVAPTAESENAAPASADAVPAAGLPARDQVAAAAGGGDSAEGARSRYLEAHFASIRDRIMKGLKYPLLARKMGWAGRVTVSFIICEDGRIEDVRVRESSGHAVLDRGAVDTIRGLTSVPRPPVRAELIMPVVYRLQ
ncbi:MAG: energy transducer TonB [Nitrospirota bacterium]|nr:energy transducer TonB [Nitrospirota bacterium]